MLATATLLFCLPAPLQEPAGDLHLRREANFARALTTELGFDEMAEEVLSKALKNASGAGRSELLLARCDVRKATARRANPEQKLEALNAAASAYADFLADSPPARLATNAQVALGELAFQYGSALQIEIVNLPVGSEERSALTEKANTLFLAAKDGLDKIISQWESMASGDEKDSLRYTAYFPAKYFKAQIFYFWAAAYDPSTIERLERSQKCLELFEDFALLAGDSSRPGFMAYKQMADTYVLRAEAELARGKNEDADMTFEESEAFYLHVIENSVPEGHEMADAEVDGRREVQQDAYLGMMKLYPKWGRAADAVTLGETFRQWVDDEGVFLSQSGYRVLLLVARNQVRSGNFAEAIAVAELVARENETSRLRLDANEVMGLAIAAAPEDAKIDLGVAYSAAEGAYFQKEFAKARDGFLLLLTRLGKSRQTDEFGAATYYYLARSYSYLEQDLEAAVSHQLGFELFPDDEEFAAKNAEAWMKLADKFRSSNPGDAALDRFFKDSIAAVSASSTGGAPDQAIWNAAQSDYSLAKDKGRAARGKAKGSTEVTAALKALNTSIASYQKIERGSRYFENAMVQIGMCEFRKLAWQASAGDEAFRIFNDYLEVFTQNPDNTPQDARGRKTRKDATSQADFYRGQTRYKQAKAGQDIHWQGVLDSYSGFPDRYPEQRSYAAAAIVSMLEAHLALGDDAAATSAYESLLSGGYPDSRISQAAHYMFGFWSKRADSETDEKVKLGLLTTATDYLGVANNRAGKVAWQNLLKEARLRLDIQQPAAATTLLEKIIVNFADDKSFSSSNRFFAQLDLVDAYLMQFNTAQAGPIIDELLDKKPNNLRVINAAAKVLVGWPVIREGRVVEVEGIGGLESYEKATTLITTLTQLAEKDANDNNVSKFEHAPYWQARMQYAYLLYKRSTSDTTFAGRHTNLISSIERLAPDLGEEAAGADLANILKWLKNRQ